MYIYKIYVDSEAQNDFLDCMNVSFNIKQEFIHLLIQEKTVIHRPHVKGRIGHDKPFSK